MPLYKITFLPEDKTIEVDTNAPPTGHDGLPGSILAIATASGIEIDHACGGVCACSTCHVIIRQGASSLNEPTEKEEDMLDNAAGVTPDSRLACVAIPDGSCDLVVEIPAWNRNLAKE